MSDTGGFTLSKEERICSKRQIDSLFGGGSHSMSAYPVRAVYQRLEKTEETPDVKILVSVPKRYFKHAVDRNRVKRQIREAYRRNKHYIINKVREHGKYSLMIAFIWLENAHSTSEEVEKKISNLIRRISEKVLIEGT